MNETLHPDAVMAIDPEPLDPPTTTRLIRTLDRRLDDTQRRALVQWAESMLAIRGSSMSEIRKARQALRVTYKAQVILPVLKSVSATLGDVLWKDRSTSARVGMVAAGATFATLGSQGAGIAALGGAIGVPLWVVSGAGAMFATQLISELKRSLPRGSDDAEADAPADEMILEADWTIDEPEASGQHLAELPPQTAEKGPDPLWKTFTAAYRHARARQRGDADE